MKRAEIEKSLVRSLRQAPSLDFQELVNIPVTKMQEHDSVTRRDRKRSPSHIRQLALAASFCLIFTLCLSTWLFYFRLPYSTIYLDVNPSIKIVTNRQDQVLSVTALNHDAEKVLGDQDYKNTDLSNTVDALLTALVRLGYLSNEKNVIMISVENSNTEKADHLALSLDQKILDHSSQQSISLTVLRQVLTEDKETSALAAENDISAGKMKLIQQIVSSNNTLTIHELAHMSMKDLITLSEENNVDFDKTIKFDSNSGKTDSGKKNGKIEDSDKEGTGFQGSSEGKGNGQLNRNSNSSNSSGPPKSNTEGNSPGETANSGDTKTNSGKSDLAPGHTKSERKSTENSKSDSTAGLEGTSDSESKDSESEVQASSGNSQSKDKSEVTEAEDSESQNKADLKDAKSGNNPDSKNKGKKGDSKKTR